MTEGIVMEEKGKSSVKEDELEKDSKKKAPVEKLGFFRMFSYADKFEKCLYVLAAIISIGSGILQPLLFLVFGELLGAFQYANPPNQDFVKFEEKIREFVLQFVYLGIGSFIGNYISSLCWRIAGERLARRVREKFLASVLRQDVSWLDTKLAGDLTSRLSTDTFLIQEGISEKIGLALLYTFSFIGSFVVAYTKGAKMAGVMTGAIPALVIVLGVTFALLAKLTKLGQDTNAGANAVALESLSAIRTVHAFGGEDRESLRYDQLLDEGNVSKRKKLFSTGFGFGMVNFMIYAFIALGLWYGGTLTASREMSGPDVLVVFFTLLVGSFSLGNLGPSSQAIGSAQGAAFEVYNIIDRKPEIDSSLKNGEDHNGKATFEKSIEFHNVSFHYPSRPDIPILKNFNLVIPKGSTVALVGSSGSGKSTIIQLLQRFYDPVEGEILLDGVNIKTIPVRHLRNLIGIVSQEPVLFRYSVGENISFGKPGSTFEEIEKAAKSANAADFIDKLPKKYANSVGERGSLLSGGQKQRVAIARAIIKNPSILLLDEATSALDSESEAIVQAALDKASVGRTSVVIAHRLSTIKNATTIVVMEKGEIFEMGSHDNLLSKKGRYYELVSVQELKKQELKSTMEKGNTMESIAKSVVDEEKPLAGSIKTSVIKASRDKVGKDQLDIILESVKKEKAEWKDFLRVLKYNKSQWYLLAMSLAAAACLGVAFPIYSLFFGKLITSLILITSDAGPGALQKLQDEVNLWSLIFTMLGVATFIANYLLIVLMGFYALPIFRKIRSRTFRNILRQEIGWFDEEANSGANLSSLLGLGVETMQALLDQSVGQAFSSVCNGIAGLAIAFTFSWQLTLINLAILPIAAVAVAIETKAQFSGNEKTRAFYDGATFVASEAISNAKTVMSLGLEDFFVKKYQEILEEPFQIKLKTSFVAALGQGLAQSNQFFVYAASYYAGAQLVKNGVVTTEVMNIVIQTVFFMALAFGQLAALLPNITKALLAAKKIFSLMDRTTKMDVTKGQAVKTVSGDVKYKGVKFSYPTRPNTVVLKGISLDALSGYTVGLVGSSGCGKSTIISLALRLYDPSEGTVEMDPNGNIADLKLEQVRNFMAIVSQEPILFARSIRENILYGKEGATEDEMIEAAKAANIHSFIKELPQGYNTMTGERGSQLSGGQKQRVAIARALIRNPKILLLDEATSALDTESEKIVQEALDKASKGRTTLVIAHRLSTIQNANVIFVFKDGNIQEVGNHQDLLAKRGIYHKLVEQQSLSSSPTTTAK